MRSSAKKSSFKKKAGQSWLTKYKPTASAINRLAPGLGRSLKTKLETTFFYTATAAATGVWSGYLNVGSCFDPTGSLADIQPVGFDQLKALYARYLVTGGSVEVTFSTRDRNTDGVPQYPWAVTMYPSTVTTIPTTFQGASSQPYSVDTLVPAQNGTRTLKLKFNTQKIVGSRLPVVAEDCGALVTADPATGQNVIVPIFAQYANAAAETIILMVKIVQDVIFDQRIQVVDA